MMLKKYIITFLIVLLPGALAGVAGAAPLLRNDYNNSALETAHVDFSIPHLEYKEALERGKIKRTLEYEVNELTHAQERLIKQKLKTINHTKVDVNPRTNFFSNDDHGDSTYQVNIFDSAINGTNDFSFYHQLPPSVNPDVMSSPYFNDYDFTKNLIEFEYELEGWTYDPTSTFEVRIMGGETFGVDANNLLTVAGGTDLGLLGTLGFGSMESDGRYTFKFDFSQYSAALLGVEISPEIYAAISDGILGLHIVRTSGTGDLYLEESELQLENPVDVPEAPTAFLLLSAGVVCIVFRKRLLAAV